MNRLLVRSLMIGLGSILCFCLVAGFSFAFSLPEVLTELNRQSNLRLVETAATHLADLAATRPEGLEPEVLGAAIRDSLQNLPVRAEYLVVTDPMGMLLYATHFGTVSGPGINLLRKVQQSGFWHEVPDSGTPRFRFSAKALAFDADESNQLFFSALRVVVLWAGLLAIVASVGLAYLLSRPQSRDARRLAEALRAMEAGRRNLVVPDPAILELKEIARSAAALQDSLVREEGIRRQWAADIAHDLRTPLTVLKGQFEGMIDGVFRPDTERLQKNYAEILRLEGLVSQLAELTRLETPGFQPSIVSIDPKTLLADLADRFSDAARKRNSQIMVENRFPAGADISADPVLLERALVNLVDNALRHGDGNGVIRLTADWGAADRSFVLCVENPGVIPEHLVGHIFDRLFRGDASRTDGGAGLGLAIAKAVALAHRGNLGVTVDRRSGVTRFGLNIPVPESLPDLYPAFP